MKPIAYTLTRALSNKDVVAALKGHWHVEVQPWLRRRLEFMETFDWRLYLAGRMVESLPDSHGGRLQLRDLRSEHLLAATDLDEARPTRLLVEELPEGRFRDLATPILRERALLPLMAVDSQIQILRVVDNEDKTRVRLVLERHRVADGPAGADGLALLRLVPLKGYEKQARDVGRLLERNLSAAQPGEVYVLDWALAMGGREPIDYTNKLGLHLDRHARADQSLRQIFLRLLNTMQSNEKGVIDDLDSEFLHDFRVAVRRTRSALSLLKKVLPTSQEKRFADEFRWLGNITSPARDMDVYLLAFEDFQAMLPKAQQAHLMPLKDFISQRKVQEYRQLAKDLNSARYQRTVKAWRELLEKAPPSRPTAPRAQWDTCDLADQRIWKAYKLIMREGRAITDQSPDEDLHELRKSAKKLRYLMEFFRSLYENSVIGAMTKELKRLQDNLGEFQDLSVQRATLLELEEQMASGPGISDETREAFGTLVETLDERAHRVRGEFRARFRQFSHKTNAQRFKTLFKPFALEDSA